MPRVHVTDVGTYHPDPLDDSAWTFDHVEQGVGLSCDECGRALEPGAIFASNLDGGDVLCTECANDFDVEVVECDCE